MRQSLRYEGLVFFLMKLHEQLKSEWETMTLELETLLEGNEKHEH